MFQRDVEVGKEFTKEEIEKGHKSFKRRPNEKHIKNCARIYRLYYNCIYMYIQGDTMKKASNIRMDEALLENLDSYAKELERTRTYLIEKAVSAYLDKLDEMIADKRIDEIKSGKTEVYTLQEVAKKLGLE